MKIIYIHQYFRTPGEGGAIRSYHLAKSLVEEGHSVEVITSHNRKFYEIRRVDGIKVHYLPVKYSNSFNKWYRIRSFFRFTICAFRKGSGIKNADLVYATSTPLTVGVVALLLKLKKKLPYFFEVRDLWPEAPLQLGYIPSVTSGMFYKLEKLIYQQAEKIITLSPPASRSVTRIAGTEKVHMIPNMADTSFFTHKERKKEEPFVVSYIGSTGKVNNLGSLINIADHCAKKGLNIRFNIMGEGSEKNRLVKKAKKLKLDNLRFHKFSDKDSVRKLLDESDASYISFLPTPVLETCSPNKFFDSIAAGKLIIINFSGWIRNITEEEKAGFYAAHDAPEEFVDKIRPFLEDQNLLLKHQYNARDLAENLYSRKKITRDFAGLFSLGTEKTAPEKPGNAKLSLRKSPLSKRQKA